MGIGVSFEENWTFRVMTLDCHVFPSSRAATVADHISKRLLKEFFIDHKKLFITSCHDDAANMIQTSKLLKDDSFQLCSAHCLHLLLTTDSINNCAETTEIIQICRNIVTTLHFKSDLVAEKSAASGDKEIIDKLQDKMAQVNNILELDDQFEPSLPLQDDADTLVKDSLPRKVHKRRSLKVVCITRWNSTPEMIESICQLKREIQNVLKRIGHADMCLYEHELDLIAELIALLKSVKDLTGLCSFSTSLTLSVIPMVKTRI